MEVVFDSLQEATIHLTVERGVPLQKGQGLVMHEYVRGRLRLSVGDFVLVVYMRVDQRISSCVRFAHSSLNDLRKLLTL